MSEPAPGLRSPALEPQQPEAGLLRRVQPINDFLEFPKSEIEQSIAQRFEKQVTLHGHRPAVKTRGHDLTYDALNRLANRIAHSIMSITNRDAEAVVLFLDHDVPLIAAILAVLKSGKFYVALDPSHPPDRIRSIIEDSQAGLLITDSKHSSLAQAVSSEPCSVLNLDALAPDLSDENLSLEVLPSALAYIVYTSGTTGKPKGVCQTHRNVLHNISGYTQACHLSASDHFSLLTLCCFAASVSNLFGALLNGGKLLPFKVKEEGVGNLCEWLRREEISVYHSVPLVFRMLASEVTDQMRFPTLRLIKLGGEQITRKDVDLFKEHFSEQGLLYVVLGASEVNIIRHFLIDRWTEWNGHLVPVGFAVEDTEVLLLDDNQKEMAAGEVGEIAVHSSYLFTGYWRNPELTNAAFVLDPRGLNARVFRTGDLGRMLPGGLLLHLGRKDFQIKIRGVRIEPIELELILRGLPEVRECVVAAREDASGNKLLVAYLVSRTAEKPDASTLRARLMEKLPEDWIPSAFVWLEQLPLTLNGKLDRQALPALEKSIREIDHPKGLLEIKLIHVWQQLFQREDIGRHDNFFALGGHSLLAARLVAEINKLLGCKLPIAALLQSPTIESLARRLTEENWEPSWSSLVPLQPLGSNPPLFIPHGWGGDVYWFVGRGHLFAPDQPVYGLQAVGLDGTSPRHTSVEDMAAHYVQEIRSFHPVGPYYLCGYSLGGVIAFEMAQQLHQSGERVAFLGLLDTVPKSAPWTVYARSLAPYIWLRLRFHLQRWWEMPNRDRLSYIRSCWTGLKGWIARNRPKPTVVTIPPGQGNQSPQVPGFKDYYQAVASAYRLRRYPGSIDLFLSESTNPAWLSLWGHLARGGAVLHQLSGNHYDIIGPDHFPTTTRILKAALQRTQENANFSVKPPPRRLRRYTESRTTPQRSRHTGENNLSDSYR